MKVAAWQPGHLFTFNGRLEKIARNSIQFILEIQGYPSEHRKPRPSPIPVPNSNLPQHQHRKASSRRQEEKKDHALHSDEIPYPHP